jgi:hypothetical protein
LSDTLPIQNCLKRGDAYDATFQICFRINHHKEKLELNGTHQLLFYADYITLLGEKVNTTMRKSEALTDAGNEVGFKVNAVLSQTAG